MGAAGGAAVAAWCVYATAHTVLSGTVIPSPGTGDAREIARLERWIEQLRTENSLSRSLLEERTNDFQRATLDFEKRHETLKVLLTSLQTGEGIETAALRGDGSAILLRASIDEAEARQSRELPVVTGAIEKVGLRAQIDTLREEQLRFLDAAEDIAVQRTEEMRGVLRLTGVGVGRIEGTQTAMGGPLVDALALGVNETSTPDEIAFAQRVTEIATRLEEARYYQGMVESLPLGGPVGVEYRLTSPFGIRTDPFTNRASWHYGLDIGAFMRAPIVSSGPGTVVFAGYRSGYGNVVDVDHGFGFVSRYAHLSAITVKKDDIVAMGDTLGLMGSSGRSTGPHLHYEVLFYGKTYDPVEFLKAGKHVHQG
jgi:murein DD-endopeptidase MepM/ murein hydrolase activator NlpD